MFNIVSYQVHLQQLYFSVVGGSNALGKYSSFCDAIFIIFSDVYLSLLFIEFWCQDVMTLVTYQTYGDAEMPCPSWQYNTAVSVLS